MGKSCKQNCFLHPYSDCEKYTNCETENKSTWKNMKNKDENISKDEILTGTSLSKMQKCNEDDVNNFYLDFFICHFCTHIFILPGFSGMSITGSPG